MLRKRREIILVAIIAALVVIAGRFFAIDTETTSSAAVEVVSNINQDPEPRERDGASNILSLAGGTPSASIRVGSNQCLQWWGTRPDAYRVEVAGFEGDDWQPNEAFLAAKRAGTASYNFPAWYRFIGATADDTEVSYRILRGLCQ